MKVLRIDLDSETPAYRQIAGELRAAIARGELAAGEVLPSVRDLAARLGLNLNTVAKAYRVLADEGVVELRQGAQAVVAAASDKMNVGKQAAPAPNTLRSLRDIVGQWAMGGVSRKVAEREIERVLDALYRRERRV